MKSLELEVNKTLNESWNSVKIGCIQVKSFLEGYLLCCYVCVLYAYNRIIRIKEMEITWNFKFFQ